jgi:hypothetical protein
LMLLQGLHRSWIGFSLRRFLGGCCLASVCPQGVNCDLFIRNPLPFHYSILFSRKWLHFL